MPGTALMWFRRDLRLADHPALNAALAGFERVVPLFVWDPVLTATGNPSFGANRLAFLAGCVEALDRSLGGNLVVRTGDPERVVLEAAAEAGAAAVYATADFGPYGRSRDARVGARLAPDHELVRVDSPYAVAPGTVLNGDGNPYQVYSAFVRAWRKLGWGPPGRRPQPRRIDRAGLQNTGRSPVNRAESALPRAGEVAAHRALGSFVTDRADRYGLHRDRPDLDTTSRLSPYLRFGCLHPRQILSRLQPGHAGHDKYEAELAWREFYADVLFHRPDAARRAYRPEWRDFQVDTGEGPQERFEAWTAGRTGFPIVDAGMRQLQAEGWMHNRVRMITASFLVKDLHVDWTMGARWFMRLLVDGDLASNQMNWQWVAGSGNDAAPFFRVFNPITQGRKFDPYGEYIRRWVPELRACPARVIHEPWRTGDPGPYPLPMVDHAVERQEALARYGRLRRGAGALRARS